MLVGSAAFQQCVKSSCCSTPRDSKLLSRKEKGFGGMRLEVCRGKKTWRNWGGGASGHLEEGAGSAGVGDRCLPRLQGGQWELGVDPLHASKLSQSHPVPLWDGRKSGSCFVIQEKTGAQTESLPSSVWMRRLLYLAAEV